MSTSHRAEVDETPRVASGPRVDALLARDAQASKSVLDALDPDQRAAARVVAGALLIIAGPGTGKTRTLTHRLAYLVRERGVSPGACLAITFTRRAACELRERLEGLLGAAAEEIAVHTFHGLGHALLREYATAARGEGDGEGEGALALDPDFRIAHEWEQLDVLCEVMDFARDDARALARARRHLRAISTLKRTRSRPEPGSEPAQVYAAYERGMRARALVDCDDLVALALELLESDEALLARYRARFQHVSVDEYQDVDELQYRLIRLLAPPGSNLCAIGDPDQAIYGFRGADVRFFLQFQADFPGTHVVQLTRNYRSGRRIVDASMQVIRRASLVKARVLEAQQRHERKLVLPVSPTAAAEAEFVVHTIERLIGGYSFFSVDSGRVDSGDASEYGFGDFAILYRSAAQLAPLEEALTRSGIPFQRRSHNRLSDHADVQRLVLALAGRDAAPGEPVTTTLARLAADDPTHEQAVDMLRVLAERCATREELLAEIAMGAECDVWDPRAARVSLLTLHASKGLEFPVVFIVGCEDGVMPLRFGGREDEDGGEERRLFFVGMTRAQKRLYLTRARKRLWRGKPREQAPSPYLGDIGEGLLERPELARRPRVIDPQLTLF